MANPSLLSHKGMRGRSNRDVRRNQDVVTYGHAAMVEDDEVAVGEEVLPDGRLVAMIDATGWVDAQGVPVDTFYQSLEQLVALRDVPERGFVEHALEHLAAQPWQQIGAVCWLQECVFPSIRHLFGSF